MSARDCLPQGATLLADTERVVPVMRWCIQQGGMVLQQNAGYRSRPSVLIQASKSSHLIKQLKEAGAETVGHQYGVKGRENLWQAVIDECLIQWWEPEVI
ncbi:hypothetical protein [Chitinibacter sp. ZOR0017]|uniref:hypothetical protein n=1 Tax=Chitinibacter sp. ZOR0017 TaxID=1339254 RepID=UPI000647B23B|nr:hypothetical protein [Chitinibacter sp. ZOR0017]